MDDNLNGTGNRPPTETEHIQGQIQQAKADQAHQLDLLDQKIMQARAAGAKQLVSDLEGQRAGLVEVYRQSDATYAKRLAEAQEREKKQAAAEEAARAAKETIEKGRARSIWIAQGGTKDAFEKAWPEMWLDHLKREVEQLKHRSGYQSSL